MDDHHQQECAEAEGLVETTLAGLMEDTSSAEKVDDANFTVAIPEDPPENSLDQPTGEIHEDSGSENLFYEDNFGRFPSKNP